MSFISGIIGTIGSAASGLAGNIGSESAARRGVAGIEAGTRESGRQFDITQGQMEPFRQAGQRGLDRYEQMLSEYDRPIPSNLPEAYQSSRDIPQPYEFDSGDYEGLIQSDVLDDFSFSEQDFMGSAGRGARQAGGMSALEQRGVSGYGMEDLSSNLANREFSRSRNRAYGDYLSGVERESERYGRSVEDYGRQTGREATLYGRGRQEHLDEVSRESERDRRSYRDYQSTVAREEEVRQRALEAYGREYVDPMNRYAELANIGQATTTGLGRLRSSYSDIISGNIAEQGRLRAAGQLGGYQARAEATRGIARVAGEYYG